MSCLSKDTSQDDGYSYSGESTIITACKIYNNSTKEGRTSQLFLFLGESSTEWVVVFHNILQSSQHILEIGAREWVSLYDGRIDNLIGQDHKHSWFRKDGRFWISLDGFRDEESPGAGNFLTEIVSDGELKRGKRFSFLLLSSFFFFFLLLHVVEDLVDGLTGPFFGIHRDGNDVYTLFLGIFVGFFQFLQLCHTNGTMRATIKHHNRKLFRFGFRQYKRFTTVNDRDRKERSNITGMDFGR
mmetsp:Transcript_25637/g.43544  ORF Transcript_25637/g.43544 Transcript_25637/m.43544 type:complete len:242 (-) Transcript_25637:89-814(-)